jgi:U4/U6.U5 tri-snRNP-associated protein 2
MSKQSNSSPTPICPYLDTINRPSLDFDFEPTCSQTLTTGPNIYACLVCGKFFRGRGKQTPAYLHSVNDGHAVFLHLTNGTFHCLPDNYEVVDPSLDDIRNAFKPLYGQREIMALDQETTLGRDLFGRRYLPGFVGLNNLNKTDCINATLQALAHVKPLRNFFLSCGSGEPFEVVLNISSSKSKSARKRKLNDSGKKTKPKVTKQLVDPNSFSHLAKCFGEMIRKMWSNKRFKSTVDPHMLVQAISVASNKRFTIGKQMEAGEFMAWFLHQLHIGIGGNRKPGSSIIHSTFQGLVEITTRQRKSLNERENDGDGEDDRLGSDDEETLKEKEEEKKRRKEEMAKSIEEITTDSNFLQLTLDISEKPLFKDDNGGLVIPQEPLVNILKKFDGVSFSDVISGNSGSGGATLQRRRYHLKQLPDYLIMCLSRFQRNSFNSEKNPTIVPFPVMNLDLSRYVFSNDKPKAPTEDEVRSMSVSMPKLHYIHFFKQQILCNL